MKMDREWLDYVDLSSLDIYPIQFANCDRLAVNNAVYIFDEVGSGKTISSGLMAIDYLYNNSGKKVLVITTNALSKKYIGEYGQFLKDWIDKLPVKPLKLENRITIVNNHYTNFRHEQNYGLVIIDEVQMFLNKNSLRYEKLVQNIRADKVIFLSATPIKNSVDDLHTYVNIARAITGKHLSYDWINEINTVGKKQEDIFCNTFDAHYPVTRYFKDTIMSINKDGFKKTQAKRLFPQLWKYGEVNKIDVCVNIISELYIKNDNNRFVIFVRYIDKEARKIDEKLIEQGFVRHKDSSNPYKTYAVVTGENAYELSKYQGTVHLPTVLILTYQVSEQGVNLPGYNYVINYHISAFPSALEQRFGRIDRMGKNGSFFKEINMCFLISQNSWDTNTCNFYCAISTYLRNLISYLPSKNTIISEEIIDQYDQTQNLVEEYIEKIRTLTKNKAYIKDIIRFLTNVNNPECTNIGEIMDGCNEELLSFIEEHGIQLDNMIVESDEIITKLIEDILSVLIELKGNLGFKKDFSAKKYKEIISSISDKVFYMANSQSSLNNLAYFDAVESGNIIVVAPNFKKYNEIFSKNVKTPLILNLHFPFINEYFEHAFVDNNFSVLFPFGGYLKVFSDMLQYNKKMSDEHKSIILNKCEIIIKTLPIFKALEEFKNIILSYAYTQKNDIRIRFDFNPFTSAVSYLGHKIKSSSNGFGLSENFIQKYWNENSMINSYFKITKENGIANATNWYKLAYHFTRRECFLFVNNSLVENNDNIFLEREKLINWVSNNFMSYQNATATLNEFYYQYNKAYKI